MTSLIEELRIFLDHKDDQLLRKCLDELIVMKKKNRKLEEIRKTLLDRIDLMTQASLTVGSGKAAAASTKR